MNKLFTLKRARPWRLAWLLAGLLSLLAHAGYAQLYYTLNDGDATASTDQLRRANADGTGDVLIKSGFVQSAGAAVVDAAGNRLLVVDARVSQPSTSLTNTKIVAVSLATGNAVSTLLTPAYLTGSLSTAVSGLALDAANRYLYYTLNDGDATASLDQLRRVNLDGTGDVLVKSGFVQSAGQVVLDAANNRVLVADMRASQPSTSLTNTKIVAVSLATGNAVSTLLTPAYLTGSLGTVVSGLALDAANAQLYYTLNDGDATASLDQLRRVSLTGTGDVLIKSGFVQSAGRLVLDAAGSRVLVADARVSQPSTSQTNAKVVAVSLAAGNATSTFVTPAYLSGSASTAVSGLALPAAVAPTVATAAASAITTTSALLGGTSTSDGGAAVTERGVVYSTTSQAPTTASTKVAIGGTTNPFSQTVTGLAPSTTYYWRAYATNSVGTSYGVVQTFTTATPTTATLTGISDVTTTEATVSGRVSSSAGQPTFGVVYSASNPAPTTSDTKQQIVGISGNGGVSTTFQGRIIGLAPGTTYSVRVYLTTSEGTTYSDVQTFTTTPLAPVVTLPASGTTTAARPTYAGTAQPGSTVTVLVDGASIGTVVATGGNFSLPQPAALAEGAHTVRATASVGSSAASASSNTSSFTVDTTPPTVAISSPVGPSGSGTATAPLPFTATFSEAVTGFTASSVQVTNGTIKAGDFSGSGTTYTFKVTPAASGQVVVSVPASAAQDAAGNGNVAASPFTLTYAQPVTATPVVNNPANGSLLNISTPTYAGPAPAGSTVAVYVDGASIGTATATGGSFSLTQPAALAEGSHTVYATAQATGSTGSANSNTNSFRVDTTPPTAVVMSLATAGSYTNLNPIPFTVTFSEPVTGFSASGLSVGGGTVSSIVPSSDRTSYAVSVTPTGSTVSFVVLANAAQDAAGNGNPASNSLQVAYVAPTQVVSIMRLDASPTSATSVRYQVQFSARVLGLSLGNFKLVVSGLSGASLASLTGAGTVFTVAVNTGAGAGTGTLRLDLTDPTLTSPATLGNAPFQGEVYTIVAPACEGPTSIDVSQVNSTSATVLFMASPTASSSYTVAYSALGGPTRTVSTSASPVMLTGLTPGTLYTVTVTSQCGNGQTSLPSAALSFTTPQLRVPENPSGTTAGLMYQYYEASGANFTRLPNFASLTPVKTSTAPNFDVKSQRQRSYGYALRYTGYVSVPTDGQYTFYTNSDDGSQLFIGTTLVVDNDGNHGVQEQAGTIGLQAGTHAFTVTYYQDGGDDQLGVSYQGPGLSKQAIPGASLRVVLPTALRTPENPAGAVAGLQYQYYEAAAGSTFAQLPAFASLTPKQTGIAASFDVASQRQRTYGYALRYTGYVTVPTDGVYTFTTGSDDGSQLFIGSQLVVDNDGDHALQERSGSIGLKAGTHAFTVTYYQDGGDDQLSVSYEGPGLAKQLIPGASLVYVPASPLRTPENPSGTVAGLRYQYYESATTYAQLPTFATEPVRASGTTTGFDERSLAQRSYGYALRYTGYVTVPTDGQYTFYTNSDDGSQLFIGTTLVVDNDGNHGVQERSGTIGLQAGTHLLTVTYYQDGGGDQLGVSYQGPGVAKQAIPAASLRYVQPTSTAATNRVLAAPGSAATPAAVAQWQAAPNPFTTEVALTFTLASDETYSLAVYDVTGRLVETLPGGQARAGEPQYRRWATAQYPSGLYLLRLTTATGTQQTRLVKH